ncbi:MAG TPA: Ig-like domain-containing protein [Rugosimonospora sp.]|nr:Ig-like domain-containing protein [Rugosimonospora sp.]
MRLGIGATVASAVLAMSWATLPAAKASADNPPRSPVVVSLTYDDGIADQMQAGSLMAQYGLNGTFYLNSGRLGQAGRMSQSDALSLQAAGNEIGGHTVTHADLPTLSPDEQARQVCNDRVALLNDGFQVTDFAYPYGDENADVEHTVANCGYNSARGVGDIVSPGTCNGCPYAETIPPADTYQIRTPDSIKPDTTLEDMQGYVLQAEQNGGGWVVLVMHHICDNCDPYSVSASQLNDFLSWLAPRAADGTVVQTVAQVIGGSVQPPVSGPPPPAPLSTTNLLRNPDMETDANHDGQPDCWLRGGYGTNTYAWSNAANPHSGSAAMRVDISNFTDGDRKIMTPEDLGACAPATVVGHTYQVSGWYQLSGNARLVAYYRDTSNHWVYFAQGPVLPATTDWRQATWTTPPMPSGTTALAVGVSLRSVGFAAGDDFSLNDSDQTPPTVDLTAPADGTRVRGTVTFTASASDASGIRSVDFLVDGSLACHVTSAPYQCPYDTTVNPDSVIAVTARATDTAGNVGLSAGRNYTVSNSVPVDDQPPIVSLLTPLDGSVVQQSVTLSALAVDNDAVSRVLFYANDQLIGSSSASPYQITWDSATVPDGAVTLSAKALDLSGNQGDSLPNIVVVDNYPLDQTKPVSTATCNGGTCSSNWYNQPVSVALSATDDASGVDHITYTTDGTDPSATNGTQYTAPFTVSTSTVVKYRAWDHAGNMEDVNTLSLNVDTVPPTAAVSAPADGSTVTGNAVYIKAAVADANGIARVYFYLDGKALGSRVVTPYQWKWDSTTVAKGPHTLYVTALDPAGNQTRSASVTVTVS